MALLNNVASLYGFGDFPSSISAIFRVNLELTLRLIPFELGRGLNNLCCLAYFTKVLYDTPSYMAA